MRTCCRTAIKLNSTSSTLSSRIILPQINKQWYQYQSLRSFTSTTNEPDSIEEEEFALPRAFLVTSPDLVSNHFKNKSRVSKTMPL